MASPMLELNTIKVEGENISDSLLACRICLASDVKLFNIREWGLDQVFVDLMGTTLSVWDGFPQHLCTFCCALLLRGRELRARCRRAEQLLKDALMHQHFITTNFIKSIDRRLHNLTHSFAPNCSKSNVEIIEHEDTQIDIETDPKGRIFLIKSNIENDVKDFDKIVSNDDNDNDDDDNDIHFDADPENDVKDFDKIVSNDDNDDDNDTHFDADPETVQTRLEDIATLQNHPEVNIVKRIDQPVKNNVSTPQVNVITECTDKTLKKGIKSSKRKLIKEKTEKKQRTTKKKGQAWRLKPFSQGEGFEEFEEKYNFKIVSLSEEDMQKEMEDRKQSDNYTHSVFKCDLCFKGFLSQSTYNNHMKTHDVTRPHGCRLCHQRFFKGSKLSIHVQDHHRLKFLCLKCNRIIKGKGTAKVHASLHAGATFKCDHCDKQFLKVTSRSTHVRMMHPKEIADGGTCTLCGEAFISAVGLRAHKTRSHEPEHALPGLRCRACKLRFESPAAIERHRRDQPGGKCDNKHSSCTQCGEVCANEQDLLTHRVEQHGLQLFTCDMCGKTFESKKSVATHIDRVHRLIRPPAPDRPGFRQKPRLRSGGRAPVCEHCGRRVSCLATLKIHMRMHTGERPYKCGVCPKAYTSPNNLKVHMESHSGARKWRCKECDATFVHQSSLYQHRSSVHSGERAFQCHICAKTFTQSGALSTHIKYVHMKVKPPPRKRNKKTAA